MRTMYDAVTPGNIPANAEMVAGYVEGLYRWKKSDWDRFPHAIKVTIAIWSADADVLDIETGDATPAMGPAWVARQINRGAFPTVYCNRSTWPAVQQALSASGFVNGRHYDLWLADYTQVPHCPSYAAACQYADPGPVDLSLCQDYWPRGGEDLTPEQDDRLRRIEAALLSGRTDSWQAGYGSLGAIDVTGRNNYNKLVELQQAVAALGAQGIPPANLQPVLDAIKALTLRAS